VTEEIDGCCPAAYVCPTSGEVECLRHGGFDCCCADRACPGNVDLTPIPWGPRRLWVEVRHAAVMAGYWLRPYDMLADRRRWRWQPRQPCGLNGLPPETRAAVIAAIERMEER
jgi:hypothetical protein